MPFRLKTEEEDARGAPLFLFSPEVGCVDVGQLQVIQLRLQSDILGSFSRSFSWEVEGTAESACVEIRGHVAGPSYRVCTMIVLLKRRKSIKDGERLVKLVKIGKSVKDKAAVLKFSE